METISKKIIRKAAKDMLYILNSQKIRSLGDLSYTLKKNYALSSRNSHGALTFEKKNNTYSLYYITDNYTLLEFNIEPFIPRTLISLKSDVLFRGYKKTRFYNTIIIDGYNNFFQKKKINLAGINIIKAELENLLA